jgi:hypothetical protein
VAVENVTYEIGYPQELTVAHTRRFFTSLSGLPMRQPPRFTDPPIAVLEVISTPGAFRHFVHCRPQTAPVVQRALYGAIPFVTVAPIEPICLPWRLGVGMLGTLEPPLPLDPGMIPVLLRGMTGLVEGEAMCLQFVVRYAHLPPPPDAGVRMNAVGRVAVATTDDRRARTLIEQLLVAYNSLHSFALAEIRPADLERINQRTMPVVGATAFFGDQSLAVLAGLPIGSPQVPGLRLGRRKQFQADQAIPAAGRRLLMSTFAGDERPLALSVEDRLRHVYLVGPTGTGKSTVMERSAIEDIRAGYGVLYIDPKGAQVNRILDRIPRWRVNDVILLDFGATSHPVGFNILAGEDPYIITDQVCGVLEHVLSLSPDSAPRASFYLHSVVLSLAILGLTLSDAPAGLASTAAGHRFRQRLISELPATERHLREFWTEFDRYGPRDQTDIAAPIVRRLQMLLYHPRVRASFGQLRSGFDMQQVLAENKILLVPMGATLGDRLTSLIGSLVMTQFWQAVRRRETYDAPFFAYADEFNQCLKLSVSFRDMCEQARGFGVGLNLAHTVVSELPIDVRRAVFGNVRSKLVFQTTSREDATILAGELGEPVTPTDIANLDSYHVIARLMADGHVTPPLTAKTLGPLAATGSSQAVRAQSERTYGKPVADVQAELDARHGIAVGDDRDTQLGIGTYELPADE